MGKGLDSGMMEMFETGSDGSTIDECVKCHWIIHFKMVDSVLYEFHLGELF